MARMVYVGMAIMIGVLMALISYLYIMSNLTTARTISEELSVASEETISISQVADKLLSIYTMKYFFQSIHDVLDVNAPGIPLSPVSYSNDVDPNKDIVLHHIVSFQRNIDDIEISVERALSSISLNTPVLPDKSVDFRIEDAKYTKIDENSTIIVMNKFLKVYGNISAIIMPITTEGEIYYSGYVPYVNGDNIDDDADMYYFEMPMFGMVEVIYPKVTPIVTYNYPVVSDSNEKEFWVDFDKSCSDCETHEYHFFVGKNEHMARVMIPFRYYLIQDLMTYKAGVVENAAESYGRKYWNYKLIRLDGYYSYDPVYPAVEYFTKDYVQVYPPVNYPDDFQMTFYKFESVPSTYYYELTQTPELKTVMTPDTEAIMADLGNSFATLLLYPTVFLRPEKVKDEGTDDYSTVSNVYPYLSYEPGQTFPAFRTFDSDIAFDDLTLIEESLKFKKLNGYYDEDRISELNYTTYVQISPLYYYMLQMYGGDYVGSDTTENLPYVATSMTEQLDRAIGYNLLFDTDISGYAGTLTSQSLVRYVQNPFIIREAVEFENFIKTSLNGINTDYLDEMRGRGNSYPFTAINPYLISGSNDISKYTNDYDLKKLPIDTSYCVRGSFIQYDERGLMDPFPMINIMDDTKSVIGALWYLNPDINPTADMVTVVAPDELTYTSVDGRLISFADGNATLYSVLKSREGSAARDLYIRFSRGISISEPIVDSVYVKLSVDSVEYDIVPEWVDEYGEVRDDAITVGTVSDSITASEDGPCRVNGKCTIWTWNGTDWVPQNATSYRDVPPYYAHETSDLTNIYIKFDELMDSAQVASLSIEYTEDRQIHRTLTIGGVSKDLGSDPVHQYMTFVGTKDYSSEFYIDAGGVSIGHCGCDVDTFTMSSTVGIKKKYLSMRNGYMVIGTIKGRVTYRAEFELYGTDLYSILVSISMMRGASSPFSYELVKSSMYSNAVWGYVIGTEPVMVYTPKFDPMYILATGLYTRGGKYYIEFDAGRFYIQYMFRYAQPSARSDYLFIKMQRPPVLNFDITHYYSYHNIAITSHLPSAEDYLGDMWRGLTKIAIIQGINLDGTAKYETIELPGAPPDAVYTVVHSMERIRKIQELFNEP